MKTLKESTADIHKKAEETALSKELISGNISEDTWLTYLSNIIHVHMVIESRGLIEKQEVLRTGKIGLDLGSIDSAHLRLKKSTIEYCQYLEELPDNKLWAHIYVHYLGHLYGGQYIKKNIKWSSNFLDFEDHKGCIEYLREKTEDVKPKEAKVAFEWIIKIYDDIVS
jgi:heme oxygenase